MADLRNCDLEGTHLEGAYLVGATVNVEDLEKAILRNTKFRVNRAEEFRRRGFHVIFKAGHCLVTGKSKGGENQSQAEREMIPRPVSDLTLRQI